MSNRSFMGHRVARGFALVLSVGLGAFVIVNAQVGCDSPASNPPAPKGSDSSEAESKPEAKSEPPAKPDSEPRANAEPPPQPAANNQPAQPTNTPAPVFMPASKSGGDFGAMHFPGEQSPTQQQQNPAPQK